MSDRKEIENKIQEWLKPYTGQKIDSNWLTKLILWEMQGRPEKVDVDGIKWDVNTNDIKPVFSYLYTDPDANPTDREIYNQLIDANIRANSQIKDLSDMFNKETEGATEVHGILANLCDIIFEDEDRASKHLYDGVEDQARHLVKYYKANITEIMKLGKQLEEANKKIARLESNLKDRDKHHDDMWSAVAGVIKTLWEDENATDHHGYNDIEQKARDLVCELKRLKEIEIHQNILNCANCGKTQCDNHGKNLLHEMRGYCFQEKKPDEKPGDLFRALKEVTDLKERINLLERTILVLAQRRFRIARKKEIMIRNSPDYDKPLPSLSDDDVEALAQAIREYEK